MLFFMGSTFNSATFGFSDVYIHNIGMIIEDKIHFK